MLVIFWHHAGAANDPKNKQQARARTQRFPRCISPPGLEQNQISSYLAQIENESYYALSRLKTSWAAVRTNNSAAETASFSALCDYSHIAIVVQRYTVFRIGVLFAESRRGGVLLVI
jgi:hypothetical protein